MRKLTPHFNISPKKRLQDPLVIEKTSSEHRMALINPDRAYYFYQNGYHFEAENRISMSLKNWISKYPLLVYQLVYTTGKVELARDSHSLLMDVLKERHRDIYFNIQKRKAKRRGRNVRNMGETFDSPGIKGKRKAFIEGFEYAYEINEAGEITLLNYSCPEAGYFPMLTKRIDRAGYYTVRLNKEGRSITKFLHRLVAEHFIPNPKSLPLVNHKNSNKLDCFVENLEWIDHSGNIKHAYRQGLISRNKVSRKILNHANGKIYSSIKEAATDCGLNYNTCRNMLAGQRVNKTLLEYYEDSTQECDCVL